MALTVGEVRNRVKEVLGDMNPSDQVVGEYRYDEIVRGNVQVVASRANMPRNSPVSISLLAGTYDYAVSATLTYQSIAQVLLNSNGRELVFVPFEQFNAYYKQETAEPHGSGTPVEWTAYENTSGLTRMRFGPTPDESDTAKVHANSIPLLDPASISFSDDLVRALIYSCASEVLLMLNDEQRAKLGLDTKVAAKWAADVERAIHGYNVRQQNLGAVANHVLRYGGRRARTVA